MKRKTKMSTIDKAFAIITLLIVVSGAILITLFLWLLHEDEIDKLHGMWSGYVNGNLIRMTVEEDGKVKTELYIDGHVIKEEGTFVKKSGEVKYIVKNGGTRRVAIIDDETITVDGTLLEKADFNDYFIRKE